MGVVSREATSSGLQRRPVAGAEAEALPREAGAKPQRIPANLGAASAPEAFPLEEPPFSLKDLRQAVPKHCFQASYATSAAYIAMDLGKTLLLWLALNLWDRAAASLSLPAFVSWAFYAVWSFYLGAVWFGVFVIGHECGHNATFPNRTVNDIVGWLLHTPLLVPYHAWRVSHSKHHNNTCSMENDEVFIPPARSSIPEVEDTPLHSVLTIVSYMTIGWPSYLLVNATGPPKNDKPGYPLSHFNPRTFIFRDRDYWGIIAGNVGVVGMLAALAWLTYSTSYALVLKYYVLPWLWCNAHLVIITWLQHTDAYVPHFRGAEWNWLRGALCTVDRTWGAHLDWTMHHITNLHVCHHIFSTMPFYHHEEATKAMLPILGRYRLYDATPIPLAVWRISSMCHVVDDEGDIVYYKAK